MFYLFLRKDNNPTNLKHLFINICVSECLHYQSLTDGNRKVSHGSSPLLCDNTLPHGWYRFQGNAGTKMPTSCVSHYRCSTHATGWLNGAHPSVEEGKVTKKVCFSWASNCCTWSINIEVLNCGDFFLYHFKGTPRNIHVLFVIVVQTEGIKVFEFPFFGTKKCVQTPALSSE